MLPVGRGQGSQVLPAWWQRGEALHPLLAVTAMVHGDEYEGFGAVTRLWRTLQRRKVHGSVLILPVCNPAAGQEATRCTPNDLDGLDLARSFPGSNRGGTTRKLARRIWNLVEPADLLVDLHSGGTGYDYLPLSGFYRARDRDLAACFPIRTLWKLPANPGVLSYELVRRGGRALGLEYRGEGRCNPKGVTVYAQGLLRILHEMKMIRTSRPATPIRGRRTLVHTRSQHTRASGWFIPRAKVGARIRKGDVIGDWIGEDLKMSPLPSRLEGTLVAIRTLPRASRGDYLTVVGS